MTALKSFERLYLQTAAVALRGIALLHVYPLVQA